MSKKELATWLAGKERLYLQGNGGSGPDEVLDDLVVALDERDDHGRVQRRVHLVDGHAALHEDVRHGQVSAVAGRVQRRPVVGLRVHRVDVLTRSWFVVELRPKLEKTYPNVVQ